MRHLTTGLGQRIKERRRAKGMKQAILARKAGVAVSYLSKLETTEGTSPSAFVLHHIATALDTTIPQLLGMPANPTGNPDVRSLPPSLLRAKGRYRLADDEVALLSRIEYRGQQPQTEEDWYFLILAIRRAVG